MRSKFLVFFLFVLPLVLPACAAQTSPAPTPTFTLAPANTSTPTITPLPSSTPTEMPTLVPPTPTFGPPLAIANFYVKKTKCLLFKHTSTPPFVRVEIWFKLGWQDMSDNEDGFWLYRDGTRVAELPPNTIEYIDIFELVKGGRTSTYYIVAFNSAGQTKSELLSYPNPC